jgi:hypothetical protein
MQSFRLGATVVEIHPGYTVTRSADGREVHAHHREQRGQAGLARDLCYGGDVEALNNHDLTHSLLAAFLGLPHSLTLAAVALVLAALLR